MRIRVKRAILPDGVRARCDLVVAGSRLRAIEPWRGRADVDARAWTAAPGLIDLQLNGAFGADFSRASAEEIERVAARLPGLGVTAFLATVISSPPADTIAAIRRIAAARPRPGSARILGIHLEGPYLNPARRGIHPVEALRLPDAGEVARWLRAGPVRMITLAPELPRAERLIRRTRAVFSLGHAEPSPERYEAAVRAGARAVTHLYNAMPPIHHRRPGIAGLALADPRVACGLIYDRVHVGREAAAIAWRCKGPDGLFLVSDALPPLGTASARFQMAGGTLSVRDGRAEAPDGTLAGGVRSLLECVLALRDDLGLDDAAAFRLASFSPARLLRLRGGLAPGAPADVVLLDRAGRVRGAWVSGRAWRRP